jgi:hypothetical protein
MENLNKFFEGKAKTNPIIDKNKGKFELLKKAVKHVRENNREHIVMYTGSATTLKEIADDYGFPTDELAKYNNLSPDSKPDGITIKIPEYFFDKEGNVKQKL